MHTSKRMTFFQVRGHLCLCASGRRSQPSDQAQMYGPGHVVIMGFGLPGIGKVWPECSIHLLIHIFIHKLEVPSFVFLMI